MGNVALSADMESYELVREYAHLTRRKMVDVVRECVRPLAKRLEDEHGVKIEVSNRTTKKRRKEGKR